MKKKDQLIINSLNGCRIRVQRVNEQEYLCLTDLAGYIKTSHQVKIIQQWLRLKRTNLYLRGWEREHNPNFFDVELEVKNLSVTKWIKSTRAIGIMAKRGANVAGTWAHVDIATEFMSSLSVEFQLHTIKELHRLRQEQKPAANQLESAWLIMRAYSKDHYRVQTDAVQTYLTAGDTVQNSNYVYASEADLLNKIIFGMSAKEFRAKNPNKKENMRESATHQELGLFLVLQALNGKYIAQKKSQTERFKLLEEDKARLLPSLNPRVSS